MQGKSSCLCCNRVLSFFFFCLKHLGLDRVQSPDSSPALLKWGSGVGYRKPKKTECYLASASDGNLVKIMVQKKENINLIKKSCSSSRFGQTLKRTPASCMDMCFNACAAATFLMFLARSINLSSCITGPKHMIGSPCKRERVIVLHHGVEVLNHPCFYGSQGGK
jgi:hypothetical protein